MSQPYIGEIRMMGCNFAPSGWQLCDGSLLPISEYTALFNLIGTTYGGDGQTTFGVPDLRGRAPLHQGNGFVIGQIAGEEYVGLNINQIPNHTHIPQAADNANANPVNSPSNNFWSGFTGATYFTGAPNVSMSATAIGPIGGSQPHNNMSPFLTVNFVMSLFGVYPSQS